MSLELTKQHVTADQYLQMIETGVLTKYDRVELIRGEIIEMTAIGSRHANTVYLVMEALHLRTRNRAILYIQSPVHLADSSVPQPDAALLEYRPERYRDAHPRVENVLLAIEVADSSLNHDRNVKIPLYAECGIPEVWLVNLIDNCIEQYREPSHDGYKDVRKFERGANISPQAFPDLEIDVSEIVS